MIKHPPTPSSGTSTWVQASSTWRSSRPGGENTGSASAARSPPEGAGNDARSNLRSSVNSHPGCPLYCGSGSSRQVVSAVLANGALHLELDEAVHLDRVLHRELLDDRLDEAVDDELGRLLLRQPVGLEVEELLLADLRHGRLVADVH